MSDQFKAMWLCRSSNQIGRTTNQLRELIGHFFESGKGQMLIQVTCPDVLKLENDIRELKAENSMLRRKARIK